MSRTARGVCVLASGGVDSSVLLADLLAQGREVHPLFIRCGFIWEKAERHWLKRLLAALAAPRLKPLTEIEVPMAAALRGHWSVSGRGTPSARAPWDSVYLPGRNLLLLSHAALFSRQRGLDAIALALLKGNPFSDAGGTFLSEMQKTIRSALSAPITIETPYRRLTKDQVRARAPRLPFELTFSCLRPRGVTACGSCNKCSERLGAISPS